MESEVLDSSDAFPLEGDNLNVDPELYDLDNYEAPDPGLLSEKNDLGLLEPQPALQLFTSSQQWRSMTLKARAHQLWLHLRTYLHDFVEKEKRAELHVTRLTHGLEPLRHLEVAAGLRSVAQDPAGGRFVVLDGAGLLHQHTKDGWVQGKLQAPVAITGLVAVAGPLGAVGRFVGWGPTGLAILRPDFSLLWLSQPGVGRALGHEPTCCLPVPHLGLLLVANAGGSLALWKFRSGGRCLALCGSPLQPPRGLAGTLSHLALGPAPGGRALRCFAAHGSAVLSFDLDAWALTAVCQGLHKTTISELAYCKKAKAMVTASRDSTVKVWDAAWQIRMVFVGHTGPVTAMAVLPNTTLVVSASQDGTLRTWDLQTAAQVGEVDLGSWGQDALSGRVNRLLPPAGPGWPVLSLCSSSVELWHIRDLYSPLAQLPANVLHLQVAPLLPAPVDPSLPARLICACTDGSVYIVSAVTGCIVTALLLEPADCAAAVAYCLPREALWLLTRTGQLVRANAACCPMNVLHRVCPPPPPEPQPCCLHLYSHLTDPRSAFACWKTVCQHQGNLPRNAAAWSWKNKNRYLPVMGHTDGSLSVLDWFSSQTVFHTEAHSPGPVTAITSTWNSIVSSGGDLMVKVWRVFPYAEESLSLLHTFSCCHPVVMLCALGKRITVGFENPNSATYGLVQFCLGSSQRCDHRPQDDPMDHITGLSCCPMLKLYACSSLDCTIRIWTSENRLLRLLQLDGAPQALAFCNDSGDLVLALGSRLCLVSHRFYLPTTYLVQKLCWKAPDVVDDPPLPPTSQERLTSSQMQRLASLHGPSSLSAAVALIQLQTATLQQPTLKEDIEALVARDQDLQQLKRGQVVPVARPPLSWKQRQEAFDNYLHLIYGSSLLGIQSGRGSQQWSNLTFATESQPQDALSLPRDASCFGQAAGSSEDQTGPAALRSHPPGAPGRRFARPPRLTLPTPSPYQRVHSKVSQLLAQSSLSSELGLSLDLQLQSERQQGKMTLDTAAPFQWHRVPPLLQRRPNETLSNLGGFFPATIRPYKYSPRPISFPGCVPNSVVLQQLWLPSEVCTLGSLAQLAFQRGLKPGAGLEDSWLWRHRLSNARWRKRLIHWLQGEPEEEEEDEEDLEMEVDWALVSLASDQQAGSRQADAQGFEDLTTEPQRSHKTPRTKTYFGSQYQSKRPLRDQRRGPLPGFLQFFTAQNWFKKLFPAFNMQAFPEMATVEGLASTLVDVLVDATWEDRVQILQALLRLLPDTSSEFRSRLQSVLLDLLNLDQPPTLQDPTQKQFVILALQLILACSLESRDVVLELMSYFLYSPAACWPEVKRLLDGLGLQDPQGFLFKEMMTWVPGQDLDSKAAVRTCCRQKLEAMLQQLQMETAQLQPEDGLSAVLPKVSQTFAPSLSPREAPSQASLVSGGPLSIYGITPRSSEARLRVLELRSPAVAQAEREAAALPRLRAGAWRAKRALSETLQRFCLLPDVPLRYSIPGPLPLEKTEWSRSRMLDLGAIEALNYFCERLRARERERELSLLREAAAPPPAPPPSPPPPRGLLPNTVVPRPRDRWLYPVLRLQEAKAPSGAGPWGRRLPGLGPGGARTLDGSIRALKLPLPRVEPQPFPPGWPAPARALPPLLLQPSLQRYFLLDDADPDSYS